MEQKINIAEILKDCPTGMELDCAVFDNVYFNKVDNHLEFPIECYTLCGERKLTILFTKYGEYSILSGAKCVIYPKEKTTWEGFQRPFEDGDVVATTDGLWIGITTGGEKGKFIPTYCVIKYDGKFEAYLDRKESLVFNRFATEEEKEKLFDAIKDNGYYWYAETKTLEKLVIKQKFKIGDCVVHQRHHKYGKGEITQIFWIADEIVYNTRFEHFTIYCKTNDLCKYELVHVEPKFKAGDKIKHKYSGIYCTLGEYSEGISAYRTDIGGLSITYKDMEQWELAPNKFDIDTLVPFESRVLVRNGDNDIWKPAIFGCYIYKSAPYYVLGGTCWKYCIPYEGNKHLLRTTNDCDDYYKIW